MAVGKSALLSVLLLLIGVCSVRAGDYDSVVDDSVVGYRRC